MNRGIARLWHIAWRALASMRLAVCLLSGLGLLISAGTLLPQLPLAADESTRTTWLALAQQKYGSLYAPLRSLGLFELYRSPGFLALVTALLVNTALCTFIRLHALSRMIRKGRITALGTLITHLAMIALPLSLAASQGYAWQENIALATGQTHVLGQNGDLLIRNDGFRIHSDAQGQPVDYVAEATLLSGEREIRTCRIRLNAPLHVAGIGVWLVSYEPGVRVQVYDAEGQSLSLESAPGKPFEFAPHGQATLNLSSGPASLFLPSQALQLYISSSAEVQVEPTFYLQAIELPSGHLLLAQTVVAGEEVRIVNAGVDVRATLYPDVYVVYRLKSDPGAVPALLSALALVVGTFLSLFSEGKR